MGLHQKVTIVIAAAFLLIATVFVGIHQSFQKRRIETVRSKIALLLGTLAERDRQPLANEIFEQRRRAIRIRLRQMMKVQGIEEISVYDNAGTVLHTEGREPQDNPLPASICEACATAPLVVNGHVGETPVLVFTQGIDAIGERLGYLQIKYSLVDIETERKTSLFLIISQLATLLLVLFLFVGLFLSRAVIAPLDNLLKGIRSFESGQAGVEVQVTGNDELGEVSQAFNRMTQERSKIEVEMAQLRNYLQNILDSMPSMLIGVDTNCRITHWNAQAQQNTGVLPDDALGKELTTIIPRLSGEMQRVNESMQTKQVRANPMSPYEDDGKVRHEDVTIYPLNADGVQGAVIRIDDVTQRYELEIQLNQARKMDAIGQLAGGIAHDFNNMLAGIVGASDLLRNPRVGLDAKAQEYVDIIISSATRASDLTRKLLAFGRKGETEFTAVDLNAVLDDAHTILSSTIDKRVKMTVKLDAVNCTVLGDYAALQNIIMNLGINAGHAMPDGGTLQISTRNLVLDRTYCSTSPFEIEPNEYVEIEVRDSGCGIAPENLQKVFEPFFTTKRMGEGTGLGLAAAYGMIQDHHGAITVYSEVGNGTVFHLYLPCTEQYLAETQVDSLVMTGTGEILLVDDEEHLRATGKGVLESVGYKVLTAGDGQEAVELFLQHHSKIDLVIMDMVMPIMNGSEAFREMKKIDPNCKVIIASGFTKDESLAELRAAGLAGFIQKPYRIAELSRLVARLL